MKYPFEELFFLSDNDHHVLCAFENGSVKPLRTLSLDPKSPIVITRDGWIVASVRKRKRLRRLKLNENYALVSDELLPISEEYRICAFSESQGYLYVVGTGDTRKMGFFHLNDPVPQWVPIDYPPEFEIDGKRFDEVLINGKNLIVVDDLMFPKWLLLYDISEPGLPEYKKKFKLKNNFTYEIIEKGAVGRTVFTILSHGVGMSGTISVVCIFNLDSCQYVNQLTLHIPLARALTDKANPKEMTSWHDIAMLDDILLLRTNTNIFGICDPSIQSGDDEPPVHYVNLDHKIERMVVLKHQECVLIQCEDSDFDKPVVYSKIALQTMLQQT